MYEKDGEQYFVFDSHLHFWDASPANWVKGQEQYAKGWIECFHAYMGLAPRRDALDARALPEVLGRGLRATTCSRTATSTRRSSSRRT